MSHKSSVALMWRLNESRYNMIGTKCTVCDAVFFPPKALCPHCRRKGAVAPYRFSGKGEIESYTIIHNAPEGYEKLVPYVVAIIKTDGGVHISGQLVGIDAEKMKESGFDLIGKKVSTVFRQQYSDGDSGLIHYGVKWVLDG